MSTKTEKGLIGFYGIDKCEGWESFFKSILKGSFTNMLLDITAEYYLEKNILPDDPTRIFRALQLVRPEDIKLIIIGQDPYPNRINATGLAFSVHHKTPVPASLRNIFKELKNCGLINRTPEHGDITHWALQGVLLINRALTVEEGKPASHRGIGWEDFFVSLCKYITKVRGQIPTIALGKDAQNAASDAGLTNVYAAPHPSPLSARLGFFGSGVFLNASKGIDIEWIR